MSGGGDSANSGGSADPKASSGIGKKVYDAGWGITLRTLTRTHKVLHKATGGRLGTTLFWGGQIIWITTWGRKSHQWRTTPLLSVEDGAGNWLITGSNAGQTKVPGWVFNARDRADGYVLIKRKAWAATFVEVEGADRDAMYDRLKKVWKSYEMYERKSGRYIPVFRVVLGESIPVSDIPSAPKAP